MDSRHIEELKEKFRHEIRSSNDSLLGKFPIEKYLELLEKYPRISGYHYVSPEVNEYTENIVQDSSKDVLEIYHQLLLVELISRNKDKLANQELPDAIKQLYVRNFSRILGNITSRSQTRGFYLYPNDKFFKDLGVCTQRFIPVGSHKIHLSCISQRLILRKGIRQFVSGLSFIAFELGGIKPVYEAHIDSHDLDSMKELNPDGYVRMLINVANLLKIRKEVKGLGGNSSWFFDPELEEISPRLSYMRKTFTDNGGKLFYIKVSKGNSLKTALLKSPTRRKLYSEGKYVPTDYTVVWARKSLIAWANRVSGVSA